MNAFWFGGKCHELGKQPDEKFGEIINEVLESVTKTKNQHVKLSLVVNTGPSASKFALRVYVCPPVQLFLIHFLRTSWREVSA